MNKQFKTISLSLLAVVSLAQVAPVKGFGFFAKSLGLASVLGSASYYLYDKGQKKDQKKDQKGTEFTKFDLDECKKNVKADFNNATSFVGKKFTAAKDVATKFVGDKFTTVSDLAQENVRPIIAGLGAVAIYNTDILGTIARAILSENIRNIASLVVPFGVGVLAYNSLKDFSISGYFKSNTDK